MPVEVFFAAPKTGHVLVTLGTRLTAVEIEHVVLGDRTEIAGGVLTVDASEIRSLVLEDPRIADLRDAPYERLL